MPEVLISEYETAVIQRECDPVFGLRVPGVRPRLAAPQLAPRVDNVIRGVAVTATVPLRRWSRTTLSLLVRGPGRAEDGVPHRHADAEVAALPLVMGMVQSVESPPVRAEADRGAVMVDPVVEEGKVVVSGIEPEHEERGRRRRTHEAEQSPDRD